MMKDLRKYIAEALGTFILVLAGLGAYMMTGDEFTTALVFGFTLVGVIFIVGPISGSHVNPAISLAFALNKKLSWKDFIFYVAAQIIGAVVAVLSLLVIVALEVQGEGTMDAFKGFFANTFQNDLPYFNSMAVAFLITMAMTFVLIIAVLGVVRKVENKTAAAFEIGLMLTAVILVGGLVNPAANIATALFSGADAMKDLWVFIAAPLVGAVLAALTAMFLFKGEPETEGTKPKITEPTKK